MEPENNHQPEKSENEELTPHSFNNQLGDEISNSKSSRFENPLSEELDSDGDTYSSIPSYDRDSLMEELISELNSDFPGIQKEITPFKLIDFCYFVRESIRLKYHSIELRQSTFDDPTILRKTYFEEFDPLTVNSPLDYRASEANLVEENYLLNYKKLLHSILTTTEGRFDNQSLIDSASDVVRNLEHKFLIDVETLKSISIREAAMKPLSTSKKDALIEFLTGLDDEPWSMQRYDQLTDEAEMMLEDISATVKSGLESLEEIDRQVNPIKLTEEVYKKAEFFGTLEEKGSQIEALSTYINELGLDLPIGALTGDTFQERYSSILRVTNQLISESNKLITRNFNVGRYAPEVNVSLKCREWVLKCVQNQASWLERFLYS
jgi:hypothetical protein